jgi:NAD(P)H-hydrate epimerase
VAFGPGMGNSERTRKYLEDTLVFCSSPIVLDADGLNVLAGDMGPVLKKRGAIVMTPHIGEFSRLIHVPITEIKKNMEQYAKDFAKTYKVILVLKDHHTIVTDGKTIYRNSTGNSHMASGGMGDCLTGLIASLISQHYEPFQAAVMGVYLHGYCGDELAKNHFCVTASDMIEKIPEVLSYFYNANL